MFKAIRPSSSYYARAAVELRVYTVQWGDAVLPTIKNTTKKPLNVPLPGGKRLFLGPGKEKSSKWFPSRKSFEPHSRAVEMFWLLHNNVDRVYERYAVEEGRGGRATPV